MRVRLVTACEGLGPLEAAGDLSRLRDRRRPTADNLLQLWPYVDAARDAGWDFTKFEDWLGQHGLNVRRWGEDERRELARRFITK